MLTNMAHTGITYRAWLSGKQAGEAGACPQVAEQGTDGAERQMNLQHLLRAGLCESGTVCHTPVSERRLKGLARLAQSHPGRRGSEQAGSELRAQGAVLSSS